MIKVIIRVVNGVIDRIDALDPDMEVVVITERWGVATPETYKDFTRSGFKAALRDLVRLVVENEEDE